MNSQEIREALSEIEEIEVQWDNRRKTITVFNFFNHKPELEALGFDCSSPMFANMTFAEEREIQKAAPRTSTIDYSDPTQIPDWAMR